MNGLAVTFPMNLSRYYHTLRYLRLRQIYGRIWHKIYHPRADLRSAPALRRLDGIWQSECLRSSVMQGPTTFRFLNITGSVETSYDWDDPAKIRLWRYNLHYFDDLNSAGGGERLGWHRSLIARWIGENPPRTGTGWEPYPTSLRIVNWIKWDIGCRSRDESALNEQSLNSLAVQTRWLVNKLEFHLLGNHLLANAKALVFAGVYFVGSEADSWLRKGLGIFEQELPEQILADGGHFERSPMYHSILLEDVLDLINLSGVAPTCFSHKILDQLSDIAIRMLRWLRVMTHPDGKIALFNDAAFDIAPDYAAIAEYAQRLNIPEDQSALRLLEALPDSGYVRLQNERAVVICDVAFIGPDYLPGHAHADSLSFELSLDGQRVLVNGGTSTYELGAERQRQRGTAAHNTVVIDGEDSSEVWGGFRVARRARPFGVSWGNEKGDSWLEASHDGYLRLAGRVVHSRRWVLEPNVLRIEDKLDGHYEEAFAAFHLHSNVSTRTVEHSGSADLLILNSNMQMRFSCAPPAEISSAQTMWHPEFGQSMNNTTLTAKFQSNSFISRLSW